MKNYKLYQLRGKRTREEVASKIGIPTSTYACIEGGLRKGRIETLIKISRFYGISVEQMFPMEFDSSIKQS